MKNFFFGSKPSGEEPSQARKASDAVEDSFLTGDELRDRKNVRLLLEAIGEVSSMRSLDALLLDIVDKAIELTRAERGVLLLHDGSEIRIRVARDARRQDLMPPLQYSTTLVKQVVQGRRPLRKIISSDEQAADLGRSVFDLKLRAVMCAPLVVKERLTGAIYVDSRAAEREFSRADLSFFFALSGQLAIAVENARLVADSVEKARLEQEMRIAGEIQKGLLPERFPEIPGVDLYGWYSPCEDATGDSYDFFALRDGRLALILGDVSGHGIGPALLAATARAALRAYLQVVPDLGAVVDWLHRDLQKDLKPGMFMTFFLAIYDPAARSLAYLNAGHPSPLFLAADGSTREVEGVEPAFGFRDDAPAKALRIGFGSGDLLLAFSDGLVEARSASGELYGPGRLRAQAERLRNGSAREIVEGAVRDALQFTGEKKADDMTLFALRALSQG